MIEVYVFIYRVYGDAVDSLGRLLHLILFHLPSISSTFVNLVNLLFFILVIQLTQHKSDRWIEGTGRQQRVI